MCFAFTSLGSDESYLSTLSHYLRQTAGIPQDAHTQDLEKEQWFFSHKVTDTLRQKAKLFSDFAEANKENKNITFLTLGLPNEAQKGSKTMRPNRTIMLLGTTGAGKSTLINGMINYILGVEWEDSFRFKLVDETQTRSQAHSQTSEVTVYKVNYQEEFQIPFSLTIVDTPGFGDTRGIVRDKEIAEQLRNLFSAKHGVSDIDAVCFVAQAALVRLTPSQKYVFDSVLSIFGKDVAENLRILVTFADPQQPPVLEGINEAGVPCPKTKNGLPVHFKFNNSQKQDRKWSHNFGSLFCSDSY
uniref:AIG1-type G domain-containing protein n=1 Tax=Cyclopterus lumpus TaxID=8103 RepID=A0A8C2W928_CYCLU